MLDKKNNFVSIIMSLFNAESTVERSIQSILNQSFSNLELIIINDNSSDSTLNIAEKCSLKDHRMKIITLMLSY